MEDYIFLEDKLNEVLNSITFACLKMIHTPIMASEVTVLQEILQNCEK